MERLPEALSVIQAECGGGHKWLIGGSCGMVLHGLSLDREPRDLDLYADSAAAGAMSGLLRNYATDKLEWSETERYRSVLSHYAIKGLSVELVGDFRVTTSEAEYRVEIEGFLDAYAVQTRVGGAAVSLMPLGHEFVFNVMRERPDRYLPIGEAIRRMPEIHLPALAAIVRRNAFSPDFAERLSGLLKLPIGEGREEK